MSRSNAANSPIVAYPSCEVCTKYGCAGCRKHSAGKAKFYVDPQVVVSKDIVKRYNMLPKGGGIPVEVYEVARRHLKACGYKVVGLRIERA